MNREVHRYTFEASVPAQEIEDSILLAIMAVEGLHGQARVRLEAGYHFDAEKHACVIDASTDVGRDVCRVFTALSIRAYGEGSFSVDQVNKEEVKA